MTSKPQKNSIIKFILSACASLSLFLGIIGIFIPLMPTTPFIILSLWLFSKSSKKFYESLISHKICGPPVKDYLAGRGIRKRYKITALTFMWLSMLASYMLSYAHPNGIYVRFILPIVGLYVTHMITSQPTCPEPTKNEETQNEETK